MNNEKETISKEEAAATLKSVDLTKRDAIKSFRIPLLLIAGISNSYALVVFSWGMTEHTGKQHHHENFPLALPI